MKKFVLAALLFTPSLCVAQDAQPSATISARIGAAIGPFIVNAAALSMQVDDLQKQIAELKRENAQLTARLNKPLAPSPMPPAE